LLELLAVLVPFSYPTHRLFDAPVEGEPVRIVGLKLYGTAKTIQGLGYSVVKLA